MYMQITFCLLQVENNLPSNLDIVGEMIASEKIKKKLQTLPIKAYETKLNYTIVFVCLCFESSYFKK